MRKVYAREQSGVQMRTMEANFKERWGRGGGGWTGRNVIAGKTGCRLVSSTMQSAQAHMDQQASVTLYVVRTYNEKLIALF